MDDPNDEVLSKAIRRLAELPGELVLCKCPDGEYEATYWFHINVPSTSSRGKTLDEAVMSLLPIADERDERLQRERRIIAGDE